ncbi:MAG: hypothetical protein ACLP5H_23615 [Desulfomonilaceae bacterium]
MPIAQEPVSYAPYFVAGGFTLLGALIVAGVNLLNSWIQTKRDKEKWKRDRREIAYVECVKLVEELRSIPVNIVLVADQERYQTQFYTALRSLRPWLDLYLKHSDLEHSRLAESIVWIDNFLKRMYSIKKKMLPVRPSDEDYKNLFERLDTVMQSFSDYERRL